MGHLCLPQLPDPPLPQGIPGAAPAPHARSATEELCCLCRLGAHLPTGNTRLPGPTVNGGTARPCRDGLEEVPAARSAAAAQGPRGSPVRQERCSLLVTQIQLQEVPTAGSVPRVSVGLENGAHRQRRVCGTEWPAMTKDSASW